MRTLAELIAFNQAHAGKEMPYFGQELFEQADAKGPLTIPPISARATRSASPAYEGIDAALQRSSWMR